MTNPTPRASAQLPPLPEPMKYLGVDDEPDFEYFTAKQMHDHAMAYAREALRAQAASSPATAVDAVGNLTLLTNVHAQIRYLIDDLTTAVDDDGLTRYVTGYGGSLLYSNFIGALIPLAEQISAALQASRQPQAQQAVAEGAGDWLHLKAYGYAPGGYMSKCISCETSHPDLDKRACRCRPCAEQMHALATKEPRS